MTELAGELRRLSNTLRNHPEDNTLTQAIERLVRQRFDVQFHPTWDDMKGADAGVDVELILSHVDVRPAHYRTVLHDMEEDFAGALLHWSMEIAAGAGE
jgi:hypothetical protein